MVEVWSINVCLILSPIDNLENNTIIYVDKSNEIFRI